MNVNIQIPIHVEDHFVSSIHPLGINLLSTIGMKLHHSYCEYIGHGFCIKVVGKEDTQKVIESLPFDPETMLEFLNLQDC